MQLRRMWYAAGAALMLGGSVCLAVLIGRSPWFDVVPVPKPMIFGLLLGLALVTVAAASSRLPLGPRARRWSLATFVVACLAEVKLGLEAAVEMVRAIDPLAGSPAGSVAAALGALAVGTLAVGVLAVGVAGVLRLPGPLRTPASRQAAERGSPR